MSVSPDGCAPKTVTATAGQVLFVVTNTGADPAEFEIIGSDQKVIDEAENIFPGFVVNLQSRLDGGTYELVCGTLTSPRGALTVSGGAAATRPPSTVVDQATIEAAVAEYRTYVLAQSDDLIKVIDTFTTAVDAGDLEAAKAAYGPSRVPWERVEPIAELFADLDPKIDAREDDYQAGVDDPGFTGYHKLEELLFAKGTTDGTSELTAGLRANVAELRTRLETLEIDPRVMTQGAGVLIDEVAQSKMTGEEDRYSKLDLWSIDPNLEGSAKIVDILRPTLTDDRQGLPQVARRRLRVGDDHHRQVRLAVERLQDLRPDQRGRPQGDAGRPGQPLGAPLRAVRPAGPGSLSRYPALMDEAKVLSRRRFLAGSAAVGAAAVAGGVAGGLGAVALGGSAPAAQASGTEPGFIPFDGPHQAGIVLPTRPQTAAIFVTLDAVVGSKAELATTIAELTAAESQADRGTRGGPGRSAVPAARERDPGAHGRPVRPDDHGRVRGVAVRRPLRPGRPQARASSCGCPTSATTGSRPTSPTATCSSRSARPTRRAASTRCAT